MLREPQGDDGDQVAEVSSANEQVDWRERAGELEQRSSEVVERVLPERMSIREAEIERLAKDRERGSQEPAGGRTGSGVRAASACGADEGLPRALAMEQSASDDPE